MTMLVDHRAATGVTVEPVSPWILSGSMIKGEFAHVLGDQFIELQVLHQMNAVDDESDLVNR